LGIEIHAGEHGGAESIWDALQYGRPDRLGHGLSAFDDPALLDELRRANVHMEFCLTSNLGTGAVTGIRQHPAGRARALGMNFSLSTDNPGAFECSLTGEFQLAMEALAFQPDDFKTVFRNALAARFQPKLRYLTSPPGL
jgi:adenosine deaminase